MYAEFVRATMSIELQWTIIYIGFSRMIMEACRDNFDVKLQLVFTVTFLQNSWLGDG
jgi:hypothetical protein